jgi:hypothetical protein
VKDVLGKQVAAITGSSTENGKPTMDQLRRYFADQAAELGINLSDPNDRIAEAVRIGLEDLDPTRVVKNCRHIHVMMTSAGIPAEMLDLPTAGFKRIVCLKHGHGAGALSLDGAYETFSRVAPWAKDQICCENCPDKAPQPDGWEFSQEWQKHQATIYARMRPETSESAEEP